MQFLKIGPDFPQKREKNLPRLKILMDINPSIHVINPKLVYNVFTNRKKLSP